MRSRNSTYPRDPLLGIPGPGVLCARSDMRAAHGHLAHGRLARTSPHGHLAQRLAHMLGPCAAATWPGVVWPTGARPTDDWPTIA